MTWRDTFRTAIDAVRSHRLRSSLTMLGILVGITAVVLTVGIGQGSSATVRDQINELGTNLLVVSPGSSTNTTGGRLGFGTATSLTQADATALTSKVTAPDVQAVSPVSTTSAELVNPTTGANWTTTLTGTTPNWETTRSRGSELGRFITTADEKNAADVVVLGPDTVTQLFGSNDPIGSSVTYNGVKLQVVGVLQSLSSAEQAASNDLAVVPLSTYAQRLVGGASRNSVSSIYVKATSSGTLSAAYQETNALLLNTHHVTSASSADFSIATQQSILAASNSVDNTLTVMLAGIAVISLLVGGIGVMNIMLVSVTERIREIGVRKAIGAAPSVIRRQFLVEASVLGLAGGLLGVALGILGAVLVPQFSDQRVILSVPASIGAIVVAVGIGVVFGVYPASRAARLAPIDALRSE
ncbi:MAG TPA: ABC transporter permease [Acidimicrobiia bacterium]|nr:ABC transporter permease [Acidimicrobiia bacterium]